MRYVLLLFALVCAGRAQAQSTFFVATNGSNDTGTGSSANPWQGIEFALTQVPDNSVILVRPGTYTGRIRVHGQFAQGVTVRSEQPYRALLRHNATVLTVYNDNANIEGITIEGFDIAHSGAGSSALVVQVQDGAGTETRRITFRNNILHDSFNNDILKINNGASDVLVTGNIFYNQQGSDEHMDINSVDNVVIEDNVLFNDFAASGRPIPTDTSSFIVIKDSNSTMDEYLGARNVIVRRNVFLNWQGSSGSNFVLLGEDGTANHEAFDVLVENNLMLGNSAAVMRAAFGCKGCRDSTFRANTVVGNLPSLAFAMRVNREGSNPVIQNIRFFNNIWSDPTGTMGADGAGSGNDFSDTPPADTSSFTLTRNVYWNNGAAIPDDPAELIGPSDDAMAIVGNPQLPAQASIVTPWWNATTGQFGGGFATIRDVFVALVNAYGLPAANGAGVGAALPAQAPSTDILGTPRGNTPDVGAVQRVSVETLFANGFE
jgi:hypothetical protein